MQGSNNETIRFNAGVTLVERNRTYKDPRAPSVQLA